MAKYYAVRNGYHTGIFNTWDECKKEVSGFSGAEYKSFTKLEDAKAFLGETNKSVYSMNRKKEKAPPLHMLTEATTSPQKNMRAELLFFMRGKKRHSAENFQIPKTPQ